MKIVIDIDEKDYKRIKEIPEIFDSLTSRAYKVIREGTPLPKGHGRLIDADTLEEKVEKHRKMLKISEYDRDLVLHYTDIEMAPTIIEEADKESDNNNEQP